MDFETQPPVELDAESLRAISAHLATLAKRYATRAAFLETVADNDRKARARVDQAANAGHVFRAYMASGMTYDQALSATQTTTGFERATIEAWFRRHNQVDRRTVAQARAIEVLRLASRGRSNTEIAAKVGVHPGHVSRIISRAIRRSPQS